MELAVAIPLRKIAGKFLHDKLRKIGQLVPETLKRTATHMVGCYG
jgi:hypothetical protein